MSRTNGFRNPETLPMTAASILSADFSDLASDCAAALDAGADALHLDVMDGHFVPNLTMGPALCKSLRNAFDDVLFDVHLMVEKPEMYVEPFADAGADHLTFHIEVEENPIDLAERIRAVGMTAGLAINPPTEFAMIEPYIEAFDLMLIMSVNPGFSGQSFIHDVLPKAKQAAARLRADQRLQFDGGVNAETASACRDAGGDVLVAASAIFKSDDYASAIASIRGRGAAAAQGS